MTKLCPHCQQPMALISENERSNLRATRRNWGLTLEAVASEIGVAKITVCYWENGYRTHSHAHHNAWRTALGME